jgi:hypothetical protein
MAEKYHGQDLKDAHALAIGKIVMAWNEYHEMLGQTYGEICGRANWQDSLSEWQSISNDHQQRQKLLQAANAHLSGRALEETIWVVETTNQMLADQRNIGVHMPLMSYTDRDGTHQILPLAMFGNRRAGSMVGRDLLGEYEHFRSQIVRLSFFAGSIHYNISPVRQGPEVWEDRPILTRWAVDV